MIQSRTHTPLFAGMILIAAVALISVPHLAIAQTAPIHPTASPEPSNTQNAAAKAASDDVLISAAQQRIEAQVKEPYRIAAAIVAADRHTPKFIANVGAFQGQFLAVFLDQFPNARGEYAEPDTSGNPTIAKKRLARYGDRVSFVVGCPSRDVSAGCVPKDADVIITEWLSIHQNLDGMYKVYRAAAQQLPSGGWFVNLDHVSYGGTAWENWLKTASTGFRPEPEGPVIHHPDYRLPTLDEQLGAMRAAGFDAQVVWQSFNTVLFMGRKN